MAMFIFESIIKGLLPSTCGRFIAQFTILVLLKFTNVKLFSIFILVVYNTI